MEQIKRGKEPLCYLFSDYEPKILKFKCNCLFQSRFWQVRYLLLCGAYHLVHKLCVEELKATYAHFLLVWDCRC